MTAKSNARRQRDRQALEKSGVKKKQSFNREKSSRCWYELKEVHMRSARNFEKTARLFGQYNNPAVLAQIARNGDDARFQDLQLLVQSKVPALTKDFQDLYDQHKDKKKLCLSYNELQEAFKIFEAYQAFDTDFFLAIEPIVNELNSLFNKALGQLLEADGKPGVDVTQLTGLDRPTNVPVEESKAEEPTAEGSEVPTPDFAAAATTGSLIRPAL